MTRLRFRVIDITTFPDGDVPGSPYADPRVLGSPPFSFTTEPNPCGGGTITIQGLTLEEASPPHDQPSGGGLNSSLSATTNSLITPLRPGDEIYVDLRLGVQRPGKYRFYVNVEVLP